MVKVYSSADLVQVGWVKSLLETEEICCIVKNQYLGSGAGELPYQDIWPELWLIDARDELRATQLIRGYFSSDGDTTEWNCPQCGEVLTPAFEWCWNCGTQRD